MRGSRLLLGVKGVGFGGLGFKGFGFRKGPLLGLQEKVSQWNHEGTYHHLAKGSELGEFDLEAFWYRELHAGAGILWNSTIVRVVKGTERLSY